MDCVIHISGKLILAAQLLTYISLFMLVCFVFIVLMFIELKLLLHAAPPFLDELTLIIDCI